MIEIVEIHVVHAGQYERGIALLYFVCATPYSYCLRRGGGLRNGREIALDSGLGSLSKKNLICFSLFSAVRRVIRCGLFFRHTLSRPAGPSLLLYRCLVWAGGKQGIAAAARPWDAATQNAVVMSHEGERYDCKASSNVGLFFALGSPHGYATCTQTCAVSHK